MKPKSEQWDTVPLLTVAPSYSMHHSWITKLPNAEESSFCGLHRGYKFGNGTLWQEYNLSMDISTWKDNRAIAKVEKIVVTFTLNAIE